MVEDMDLRYASGPSVRNRTFDESPAKLPSTSPNARSEDQKTRNSNTLYKIKPISVQTVCSLDTCLFLKGWIQLTEINGKARLFICDMLSRSRPTNGDIRTGTIKESDYPNWSEIPS